MNQTTADTGNQLNSYTLIIYRVKEMVLYGMKTLLQADNITQQ